MDEIASKPAAFDDLFMVICQNNQKKTVKVQEVSPALARLLGRVPAEMEGVPLADFLGDKTARSLNEYLEFEDHGDDVHDILGRVRDFKLKHFNGQEIVLAQKFHRETAREGHQWFRLVLKDERRQIQEASFSNVLKENLAGMGTFDEVTGLADAQTGARYLEQIYHYVRSEHLTACFALIRLDRYENSLKYYGKSGVNTLIEHVARNCKATFREEDLVYRHADDMIGLVLMDAVADTSRIVLNRLRWAISSHRLAFGGKSDFSVTVSICFAPLESDDTLSAATLCERCFETISRDERNRLQQATMDRAT